VLIGRIRLNLGIAVRFAGASVRIAYRFGETRVGPYGEVCLLFHFVPLLGLVAPTVRFRPRLQLHEASVNEHIQLLTAFPVSIRLACVIGNTIRQLVDERLKVGKHLFDRQHDIYRWWLSLKPAAQDVADESHSYTLQKRPAALLHTRQPQANGIDSALQGRKA